MDAGIVASELQTHKIRQGPIYKRTKFLQEWEERWAVLTMNFFFIFANRALKEVIDYIDLRDVLSYKSYLRKDDDMIPAGFKLTTQDEMYYFCARNCNEKWSWMVSIQRLMDFKYTGKSPYNNLEWISSKGFMSQGEFERGKFDDKVEAKAKEPQVVKVKTEQKQKIQEKDLQKLKKQVEETKVRLAEKEEQILRKQKQQEQIFIIELNKLKKAEQQLKEIQAQVEHKARQAEKILLEGSQAPKQIIVEKIIEVIVQKIVQKPIEVVVEKSVQVIVEKPVQVIIEKQVQVIVEKPIVQKVSQQTSVAQIDKKQAIQKKDEVQPLQPTIAKKQSTIGQRVSEMKKLYESKMDGGRQPQVSVKSVVKAKEQTKSKEQFLHLCRDKVIVNIFQEFHSKAYTYGGLRYIVEFIIKICSERSLGYLQYLIRQAKSHENRYVFAEVFLELLANSKDYTNSKSISKLVEVLIFQAPGIFKLNHFDIIKRKIADHLIHSNDEGDLAVILKTMYVVHKVKKYEKDQALHEKLVSVEKMKSQEAKNWARKLLQDL